MEDKVQIHELRHLTHSNPRAVESDITDPGWNCCENSFVAMYVLRMMGYPVDVCFGKALFIDKEREVSQVVDPHYWVGSVKTGICDFSLSKGLHIPELLVLWDEEKFRTGWSVKVTLDKELFANAVADPARSPSMHLLLYCLCKIRKFVPEEIEQGYIVTGSPRSGERLGGFSFDLLAKIVVHTYLVGQNKREPMIGLDQNEALKALDNWSIDAVGFIKEKLGTTSRWR